MNVCLEGKHFKNWVTCLRKMEELQLKINIYKTLVFVLNNKIIQPVNIHIFMIIKVFIIEKCKILIIFIMKILHKSFWKKKKSLDNFFLPGLIIPRTILCRLTNAYIHCCGSHSHEKLMCILSLSVYNPKLLGEFSDLDF